MVINAVHTCETTFVSAAQPDQNFCNLTYLTVDNRPSLGSRTVGLLKFNLPTAPAGFILMQATLSLYVTQTGISLPCNGRGLLVYNNLADFTASSVTWNTRPATEILSAGGTELCTSSTGQYAAYDITVLAQGWENGSNNYGITLDTPEQNAENPILIDSATGTHPPLLTLDYQVLPKYKATLVPAFDNKRFQLLGTAAQLFTTSVEIAYASMSTFMIQNLGTQPFIAFLQLSPDKLVFINDAQRLTIQPGASAILCPYYFARYVRMMIDNSAYSNVNATVWVQTQNLNYTLNYQI